MIQEYSPYVIQFSESFGITWYGLFYLSSVIISYLIIFWFSRRQNIGLTNEMIIDFIGIMGLGLLIGGRLGYLIYEPSLLIQFKSEFPYWGLLSLGDGGLSIHGAIMGAFISTFVVAYRTGISHLYLMDLSSIVGAFSIFLGRLSNYFIGEYIGKTLKETHGLGTEFLNNLIGESFSGILSKFPQEILYWPQLYFSKLTSLSSVIDKVSGQNLELWSQNLMQYQDNEISRVQVHQTLESILSSIYNGNHKALDALTALLEYRHPVQLYAAFVEGIFIFIFLFFLWYSPRKPGVIAAFFLILDSLIRIWIEQFALPDAQIGYRFWNITEAQILSFVMLILGLWMLFIYNRGSVLKFPGWGLGQNVKIHRRRL